MNNEQAIKRIQFHISVNEILVEPKLKLKDIPEYPLAEALNMAIDALKENENLKKERDKYKGRYEILEEKIWRGHLDDLEYMIDDWEKEDENK